MYSINDSRSAERNEVFDMEDDVLFAIEGNKENRNRNQNPDEEIPSYDYDKQQEAEQPTAVETKVAVGSMNPAKINAAESVFKRVFGEHIEIIPVGMQSIVSDQPMSEAEAVEGAISRARRAIHHINANYGVGMEGCIYETSLGYFLTGWCAVIDRNGKIGLGSSGHIQLPEIASQMIVVEGKELGDVMDELTGEKDVKKRMGTVGILTKGFDNRQNSWETALLYALAQKINPEIYKILSGL